MLFIFVGVHICCREVAYDDVWVLKAEARGSNPPEIAKTSINEKHIILRLYEYTCIEIGCNIVHSDMIDHQDVEVRSRIESSSFDR